MRTAVLVVNYITIGLIVLAVMLGAGAEPETAYTTILGCFMFLPAPIIAVIYAHRGGK